MSKTTELVERLRRSCRRYLFLRYHPLSLQTPHRRPPFPGAVRRKRRSSSVRRWRVWKFIVGQMVSPALRLWRSCVMKWMAKLSPRRCWAECLAGRGFR